MSISEGASRDLPADATTAGQLNVFGRVLGRLAAGDADAYRVYLEAGRAYTFAAAGVVGPVLELLDASGRPLGSSATGRLDLVPAVSGVALLRVSGGTGDYAVSLATDGAAADIAEGPGTASALPLGGRVASAVEVASDIDWHRLDLVAGRAYAVTLQGTLPAGHLALYDAAGRFVQDLRSGEPFLAGTDGPAYLYVADRDFDGRGDYTVALEAASAITVDDAAAHEASGRLVFTLRLSQPSAVPVTVTARTRPATATEGEDYAALAQTVSFAPGTTRASVTVPLLDDARLEPDEVLLLELSEPSGAALADARATGAIDDDEPWPAPQPTDPWVGFQWHLFPGAGANVLPVTDAWSGRGVVVGVFDQGVEAGHPELRTALAAALGRRAADLAAGGAPETAADVHGTAVAGVIAAARDGRGFVGVAPGATLASLYSPLAPSALLAGTELENGYRWALQVDVLNGSFGLAPASAAAASGRAWAFADDLDGAALAAAGRAMAAAAAEGRGGLGTVLVQAAGNGAAWGDDTNLHGLQNRRHVVTVGATDHTGRPAPDTSPGASVLVAAPGGSGTAGEAGQIWTTDRSGAAGYAAGDFAAVQGSSFAAAIVSGVVALMLEANPRLGWRDVQTLLAVSARPLDAEPSPNGATTWNGGGLLPDVARQAGFGRVDAAAAVRLAETWAGGATSANEAHATAGGAAAADIPDAGSPLRQAVAVDASLRVERVELHVRLVHDDVGQLTLRLTSPAGTESVVLLALPPGVAEGSRDVGTLDFRFSSVRHLGEPAAGAWTLSLSDGTPGGTGRLLGWTLDLHGRPDDGDDVYVYTDAYADAVAKGGTARTRLADPGGRDTLNAAAVSGDSRIDLEPGATGRLAGQPLAVAEGTVIERAYGGPGRDEVLGNAVANALFGQGGDDRLDGRGGDDRLAGGAGNDWLDGGAGIDTACFDGLRSGHALQRTAGGWTVEDRSGRDGTDVLAGVERLQFADDAVALDLDGAAGEVARIIGALFGPSRVHDAALVGLGLRLHDAGTTGPALVALATPLVAPPGAGGDTAFVEAVYGHVTGLVPDAAAIAPYVAGLALGAWSRDELAWMAVQLDLTAQAVGLAGLATQGLPFEAPPAG